MHPHIEPLHLPSLLLQHSASSTIMPRYKMKPRRKKYPEEEKMCSNDSDQGEEMVSDANDALAGEANSEGTFALEISNVEAQTKHAQNTIYNTATIRIDHTLTRTPY